MAGPFGTNDRVHAGVISSDVPIIVQHTRLDSRQPELGLLSTMAHPARWTDGDGSSPASSPFAAAAWGHVGPRRAIRSGQGARRSAVGDVEP